MAAKRRPQKARRKAAPSVQRAYSLGLYNPILKRMRTALERTNLKLSIPAVLPREKVKP